MRGNRRPRPWLNLELAPPVPPLYVRQKYMAFTYDMRCLECLAEYELHPREVMLGPLGDEFVTVREDVGGITCLRTTRLYRGEVMGIYCPSCILDIRIASDLAPHSLRLYFQYQRDSFSDLKIEHVLEWTAAVCRIREFPVLCPRCEGRIEEANLRRRCRLCGSNQLQLLRSRNDQAEPVGTGQPATRPVDDPEGGDKPQPEAEGRRP